MKKILFILFSIIVLSSCYKEEEPRLTTAGEWRLTNADLFIKRWGNYPLKRYCFFKSGQDENCIDLSGFCLELDIIHKGETKWTLLEQGGFILNDTITYETQCNAWSMRVFPTENGSARVYIVDSLAPDFVRWMTSEREQALTFEGVYDNYTYFSKLEFIRIK